MTLPFGSIRFTVIFRMTSPPGASGFQVFNNSMNFYTSNESAHDEFSLVNTLYISSKFFLQFLNLNSCVIELSLTFNAICKYLYFFNICISSFPSSLKWLVYLFLKVFFSFQTSSVLVLSDSIFSFHSLL